jgi:hypothetical protein
MTKIDAKVFLEIWEKVAQREHLTDRGLSLKIGVTPSAVTHWRNRRTAFVMPGLLRKLEERLGYTVEFGKDGTWQLHKKGEELTAAEKAEGRFVRRPEHRIVEALAWPEARKISVEDDRVQFNESGGFSPLTMDDWRENIWVQMEDDSMSPVIPKGSWLLVQKKVKPNSGGIGVFAERSSQTVIIGIVTIDKGKYQIKSASGKLMSFKPNEISSSYRVLAIVYPRDSARISSNRKADHKSRTMQSTHRSQSQEE